MNYNKNGRIKLSLLLATGGLVGQLLVGCGSTQSKTVPEDETNWGGGPMPKNYNPQAGQAPQSGAGTAKTETTKNQ